MSILRAKSGMAFELAPANTKQLSWIDKLLAKS